jgi:hypothetical protein
MRMLMSLRLNIMHKGPPKYTVLNQPRVREVDDELVTREPKRYVSLTYPHTPILIALQDDKAWQGAQDRRQSRQWCGYCCRCRQHRRRHDEPASIPRGR